MQVKDLFPGLLSLLCPFALSSLEVFCVSRYDEVAACNTFWSLSAVFFGYIKTRRFSYYGCYLNIRFRFPTCQASVVFRSAIRQTRLPVLAPTELVICVPCGPVRGQYPLWVSA
ncbi:hypothetical protein EDB86DRAFT_2383692 [Lactarius hatsudake]|nr:hypothetical protein EDB86DRAFT_2383692 [Lactarius hatsudake]